MDTYNLIIIGAGTTGYAAGLYAGRYLMKTLLIGEVLGGEGTTAGVAGNYPGFLEIDGFDLMEKMKEQVLKLGIEIKHEKALSATRTGHCFTVRTKGGEFTASTLLLATGTERRKLGIPREDELKGKGVHYCVTCDGPLYRGKSIALVGGGDASVKGINLIAEYVDKVYLIVRGKELVAEPINLEQMKKLGDKVEILYENEVKELVGKERVEGVRLRTAHNDSESLKVSAVFVEIGAEPRNELAKELGVELDERGYIKVDALMQTNVDGVYAGGDATSHFGSFKQYVTAAALGAVAATSAYNDHKIHGDLCPVHFVPKKVEAVHAA